MVHEYPLGGTPPMMTHIHENDEGDRIIAAKGTPEAIVSVCSLPEYEKEEILQAVHHYTKDGYRVLGVATALFNGNHFPSTQQEFPLSFIGLVAFYDPPKEGIR